MHDYSPSTPANGVTVNKLVTEATDANVLEAIRTGNHFRELIALFAEVSDRTVDNTLRRLKAAKKVSFLGAKATQGWRLAEKAPRKPKVTRKVARPVRAAKKVARTTPGHLANVHCFLSKSLVKHVKKQLKPGETFTDAVAAGLAKKYGTP